MKWPLVEIRWVDSCAPSGWTRLSGELSDDVSRCVSVGFLIRDTHLVKVVAAHVDAGFGLDNPNIDGVMHIPTCAVTSMRIIEPADADA